VVLNGLLGQIKYESHEQKLGTQFRITFYCQDSLIGKKIAAKAWRLVDDLNMVFSDYEEFSEVTLLSKSAGSSNWIKVSDPLWEVLEMSQDLSVKSDGAFDITIGPLSKLWRRAFRRNMLPQAEDVAEAKSSVNYKWLHLDKENQSVLLEKTNMRIDLGGIAKGYIIDQVFDFFEAQGIEEVLIDGGGDLYVGANSPEGIPWEVAIGSAEHTKENYEFRGVASSGDYYRYLESEGVRYSHIIDPRTGYGNYLPSQVVVSAPSCALADALASSISILGVEKGEELMNHYPQCKLEYLEKKKL